MLTQDLYVHCSGLIAMTRVLACESCPVLSIIVTSSNFGLDIFYYMPC